MEKLRQKIQWNETATDLCQNIYLIFKCSSREDQILDGVIFYKMQE